MNDYHIARQRHLGDALDRLQSMGPLRWKWRYDAGTGTAHYMVSAGEDGQEQDFGTRDAEKLVKFLFDCIGIKWEPMPYTGYKKP